MPAPTGPLRILLVEDDPSNAEIARLTLAHEGYEVALAANGIEALDLAATDGWSALVLDIHLPGRDGMEVLRRLRAAPRTAGKPIVCVSANARREETEEALAAGADAYVVKPYRRQELVAAVKQALDARPLPASGP